MAENKIVGFWKKCISKLKKIKHFEIILVVVFIAAVLLIWFADFGGNKTNKNTNEISVNTKNASSLSKYTNELEQRLCAVLSEIDGAGKVSVMITFDGDSEVILATTKDEKSTTNTTTSQGGTKNDSQTKTVSSEPVLITQNGTTNPIVLMEIMPQIKGVIVVAQGANNVRVKLDLLKAVEALLNVNSGQVEIFKGN